MRTLIVPKQAVATYITQWKYDSHNRLLEMIYPDEEKVTYGYNLGGQIDHVRSYKSYGYDYVNSEFSGGNTGTTRFSLYVNPYLVAGQGGKYTKHIYISAPGESHFPSGLAFPHLAKVIFRVVWHFRAGRKSFSEWFGIFALGESHFLSGLTRARIVYL